MARTKAKRTRVYECDHYQYEYDDWGKYCWCHNTAMQCRECKSKTIYGQRFCPGYKKGRLCGTWEITEWDRKLAMEFKESVEREAKELEARERAILKYLKEKYEP